MATISGLQALLGKLQALAATAKKEPSCIVGFTAAYSMAVHEDLQMPHKVGQAKFLEQPAREMKDELGQTVKDAMKSGKTLEQGLLLAGLKLQRAAMLLTPVDTGALRASAFTRLET